MKQYDYANIERLKELSAHLSADNLTERESKVLHAMKQVLCMLDEKKISKSAIQSTIESAITLFNHPEPKTEPNG